MTASTALYISGSLFLLVAIAEWLIAWFQPDAESTLSVVGSSTASAVLAVIFFLLALMNKFGI